MKPQHLLLLLALSAPAFASGDKGFGPFAPNPTYTTGKLEFFLEIYVDPEQVASQIEPTAPPQAPGPDPVTGEPAPALHTPISGDLVIKNATQSWVDVKVNGVKVGRIGPLTTAVMHGMRSGVYDVTFTLPNGYSWTDSKNTVMPSVTRDSQVEPLPLLQGNPPASE